MSALLMDMQIKSSMEECVGRTGRGEVVKDVQIMSSGEKCAESMRYSTKYATYNVWRCLRKAWDKRQTMQQ